MTLTVRIFGREFVTITTDPTSNGDALDVTTYPVGFTQRGPHLTDGRYGCED